MNNSTDLNILISIHGILKEFFVEPSNLKPMNYRALSVIIYFYDFWHKFERTCIIFLTVLQPSLNDINYGEIITKISPFVLDL